MLEVACNYKSVELDCTYVVYHTLSDLMKSFQLYIDTYLITSAVFQSNVILNLKQIVRPINEIQFPSCK